MSDPLIRELDNFVVLEPGAKEKFLTTEETLEWLSAWLEHLDELPRDLKEKKSLEAAAQHLLDTACVLEITQGFSVQWFAVRLDQKD